MFIFNVSSVVEALRAEDDAELRFACDGCGAEAHAFLADACDGTGVVGTPRVGLQGESVEDYNWVAVMDARLLTPGRSGVASKSERHMEILRAGFLSCCSAFSHKFCGELQRFAEIRISD